jgi:hypothetical protein
VYRCHHRPLFPSTLFELINLTEAQRLKVTMSQSVSYLASLLPGYLVSLPKGVLLCRLDWSACRTVGRRPFLMP